MSQKYEIEDLDITKENEHFYFKCSRCGTELDGIKSKDNKLGQELYMCKHWCDRCFEEIKRWIRTQKNKLVKERIGKEIQTTLNVKEIT